MKILCFPTTSVELVRSIYAECPRLSGHMVEHLFGCGNPHRFEILQFLSLVNWFTMAGRDVYETLRSPA